MSDGRTWGAVIGGVAAYFTGGLSLVGTGVAVGGAVGGLLEPKKRTETNRIDDIKVSLSKYGDMIPETSGNNIPSATCVWSTYIIELPEKQSGGKGGGVENTNYRQFIQSMWCLGKTPPEGSTVSIRKVWIDGKLNFDASSGLSVRQALATKENPWAEIALLPGFDDQLPVPMIETYEGVGNVPAFRGRVCVFIFGLECPGGRVPQLQFELCVDSGLTTTNLLYGDFGDTFEGWVGSDAIWAFDQPVNEYTGTIRRTSGATPVATQEAVASSNDYSPFDNYQKPYPALGTPTPESVFLYGPYEAGDIHRPVNLNLLDLQTGESRLLLMQEAGDAFGSHLIGRGYRPCAAFDPVTASYVVKSDYASYATRIDVIRSGAVICSNDTTPDFYSTVAFYDGFVYVLNASGTNPVVVKVDGATGVELDSFTGPSVVSFDLTRSAIHASSSGVAVFADGVPPQLLLLNPDDGTFVVRADDASLVAGEHPPGNEVNTALYYADSFAVVGPSSTGKWTMLRLDVADPQPASVAEFIKSQNLRAGLTEEQIDVDTIDDSFWGLTLKSPASARANIGPLLTYSAIGVVEEDAALRYFHRKDKTSVVTVPYEDLGFAEDGSEPGDPFPLVHLNAQELPRSITVSYNDYNFDYQVSTAKAMRYAVDSVLDENVTLDIATNGERAATIAYRLLFERWLAQNTRSCAVSRAYAYLSAGDVVTMLAKDGSYGDWMISKATDTGARIEWEMFPADSDLLIQVVPGPGGYRAQTIDELVDALRAQVLDMAIVRDEDDNPGTYVAIDSYGNAAARGELFVGDDDAGLTPRGIVQASAPIGFAETTLPDAPSSRVDEVNLLTVNLGDDVFESCTREVLVAGGGEYWAYGKPGRWEVGASAVGDDLGGGRFILSRHLRGQFGTEWAAALHEAGDTFVLLREVGMLRPSMGVGELGLSKRYRAVAQGRSFNSAASQNAVNTGEGLKPLSPVDLRRTSTNDLTVDRRSRLSMNNSTGVLPLGEANEAYSWSFYASGAFSSLIGSAVTTSRTITAAQITAAGANPAVPLFVRVAQISDSVGRGHELQATA